MSVAKFSNCVSRSLGRRALQQAFLMGSYWHRNYSVSRSLGRRALQHRHPHPGDVGKRVVSVDRLVDGHCNLRLMPGEPGPFGCQSIAGSTGTAKASNVTNDQGGYWVSVDRLVDGHCNQSAKVL